MDISGQRSVDQRCRDRQSHRHDRQRVTLTGAQLDAIITGAGTINLGEAIGDIDTIILTRPRPSLTTWGRMMRHPRASRRSRRSTAADGRDDKPEQQTEAFTIAGSNNNDTLTGGDGDDTIRGDDGADTIDGGKGDDTINLRGR